MNRRSFLSLFGAGVAGIALDQAIPFNRVWSFPKEIVVPKYFAGIDLDHTFPIGTTIRIRTPERWIVSDYDFYRRARWRYEVYLGGPLPEGVDC